VVGNVYYTFLALDGPCETSLSPYQEVASGFDNEKFNGDYGIGVPPVGSEEPEVTLDKDGNVSVSPGERITYTLDYKNNGSDPAGLPLYSSGLVFSDTVPVSTTFTGDTDYTDSLVLRYSTDGGRTWTTTLPSPASDVTNIQWWLSDPLAAGADGVITFSVQVDPAPTASFIENCADASFGAGTPFAESCHTTIVSGTYSIGDFVWRDMDRDGDQDGGPETGINGVQLYLYWDKNGDQTLDSGDLLLDTLDTYTFVGSGYYTFTNLPAGDYLVVVDEDDASIPLGYRHTTPVVYATTLSSTNTSDPNADFGFGPTLSLDKALVGGYGYEGQDIEYRLTVRNLRPGGGETVPGGCQYTAWAQGGTTGNSPKNFTDYANAFGVAGPDGNYASGDFKTGANKWINGTTFDVGSQAGNVIRSVVAIQLYVDPALDADTPDFIQVEIFSNTVSLTSTTFVKADLDSYVGAGNAGLLLWDITGEAAWDWADFAGLEVRIDEQKDGQGDDAILYIDAIGFQVTSDAACAVLDADDVIVLAALTDTYDTSALQYVSSNPTASSVDTSAGVITWINVGPIYPGEAVDVSVIFSSVDISSPVYVTNTTCISDLAQFADGGWANDACDLETGWVTPTGYISGVVWSEGTGGSDGWAADPGYESGIDLFVPGVTLNLYQCVSPDGSCLVPPSPANDCGHNSNNGEWVLVGTQVTDANGHYVFEALAEGYYYVAVDTGSILGFVGPTDDADDADWPNPYYPCTDGNDCDDNDNMWGSPSAELVEIPKLMPYGVGALEAITNTNFGYTANAALYGIVWEDVDGDGVREDGEEGIGGVVITLTNSSTVTTTTSITGYYEFTGITSDTYTIAVDVTTLPLDGSWTQTDDPDATLDDIHTVYVPTSQVSGSHDFGYHRHSGPYEIGDLVYADWNGDGNRDDGEEGLSGITVNLYVDSDGDGSFNINNDAYLTTTVTTSSGYYTFTGLVTGTHFVVVDETPLSSLWDDYEETQDPDEDGVVCTTCDGRGSSTVSSTLTSDLTVDFGYQPKGLGSIGDFVWKDLDGDGIQDGGSETGIPDITVSLYEDDGDGVYEFGIDALVVTATTNSEGAYLFEYLPAGDYLVVVDTADGELPTDDESNFYILTTDDDPHPVTLTTGQDYLDADFGFTAPGKIGDYVWRDSDADGIQDAGENGINGVTVRLYNDVDGNGVYEALMDTLRATTATDASGVYSFTGVPSGNYVVVVDDATLPSNINGQTYDPDRVTTCADTSRTDQPACDHSHPVSLRPGQVYMSADFGYDSDGIIGDYVWLDADRDGVQDSGELGFGGVVITLTDGDVLTTTTDSDGYYSFGGLTDDVYTVTVDISTLPTTTLVATYEYSNTLTPNSSVTVTLSGGTVTNIGGYACTNCSLDVDFGYDYPSGIYDLSGNTFYDEDNDGYPHPETGEDPYPGVTVYLWLDEGGGSYALQEMTDTPSSGYYIFTNLYTGTYKVSTSPWAPGGEDITTSNVLTGTGIVLNGSNPSSTDNDFGFYGEPPTAVVLSFFKAEWDDDQVWVTWETALEINTVGFNLWRGTMPGGPYERVNARLIPAESLGGLWGGFYEMVDSGVAPGTVYYYKLEELEVGGKRNWYGPVSTDGDDNPTSVTLFNVTAGSRMVGIWRLMGVAVVASLPLVALVRMRKRHR
jgi:uncharacterized repeat protein (TIGR01451 family)